MNGFDSLHSSTMYGLRMKTLFFLGLTAFASAKPSLINDAAAISSFEKGIGAYSDEEKSYTAEKFVKELKAAPESIADLKLATEAPEKADSAVYLVGAVYNCGKCEHWHAAGIASAWALTSDGVMVTNYHVFEKAKGDVMGVSDLKGRAYPVTKVLAASKVNDIVIFQTTATDIAAFPLGAAAEVGSELHVISHPKKRFYTHTTGIVSRYHLRPNKDEKKPTIWMSITADYAVGSSGGPVLNSEDHIVGMVSNTQSIYYGSNPGEEPKGPLQMVIKNCVPVSAIKAITGKK
ncbi:MAG: serine protease [Akkermansiaceae bacterium]|jgi:serine protease Do|nr:serine protease [Akkermansiaceae bacterium]MDP4647252.1 serine protease [Akkermansiaceae bacterium]MDP4848534.1 serine protease [Akkermansiaceae bacterium]